MKNIIKMIKGMIVGFIIIIPGVSGSMIAAALNIYEDLISALSNITKKPVKSVLSVWQYIIGIIIGVGLGVVFVATIYTKFPIQLTALFIGLIIGGIPKLIKENKKDFNRWYHMFTIVITILLVGSLLFVPTSRNNVNTNGKTLVYLATGLLLAGPIIIPGISGAMVLSMIGLYNQTMTTISNFFKNLVTFQFQNLLNGIGPIIFIGIGAALGLVIFAKIIKYILEKYPVIFNAVILGVLLVAPLSIIVSLNKELSLDQTSLMQLLNTGNLLVGIVFLIFGFLLSYQTSDLKEKQVKSAEVVNVLRTTKYMFIDAFIIASAYALTMLVFYLMGSNFDFTEIVSSVLTIILAKITLYYFLGLYRIIIKHLNFSNLVKIIVLILATNVIVVLLLILPGLPTFMYKSAYIFITAIEIALLITYRIVLKYRYDYIAERNKTNKSIPSLIIGAGEAGEMALIEINRNVNYSNYIVGFLDDDIKKLGRTILEKPILGAISEINYFVDKFDIKEVFIAIADYNFNEFLKHINPEVRLRSLIMESKEIKIKDD